MTLRGHHTSTFRKPSLSLCRLAVIAGLLACSSEAPLPVDELPPEAPEAEPPAFPAYPLIGRRDLRRAPQTFDHLVPRLLPVEGPRFRNLVYEATNVDVRGARAESGLNVDTGEIIADRWRRVAAGTKRTLAIRDALFSQQDHPTNHEPVSVMMPLSWVTVAVNLAMNGEHIERVSAPALDDDRAWEALETPRELFGSFPASDHVHREATKPRTVMAPQRLVVTNARRTVHMLAAQASRLVEAAADGPEAIARVGAECISESDRRYFGERLRREHIVLVAVENPSAHERVDQARGFLPPRGRVSDEALMMVEHAVLRRRLEDGDIGVQRVDLNRMSERRHMVRLLEALVPKEDPGRTEVWIYVHGEPRAHPLEDAFTHIYGFNMQLQDANVNRDRIRLFIRPSVPVGGTDMAMGLFRASRRYRNHDLPMGLNIGTSLLTRIFDELAPTLNRLAEGEGRRPRSE